MLRPLLYWHVFYIFETPVDQPLAEPYGNASVDLNILIGDQARDADRRLLASMGELSRTEIDARFGRGDGIVVASVGAEPTGYMWIAFASGVELALGLTWRIRPTEAVKYGSFVSPRWRGRGIHSVLNHALNRYASEHGKVRALALISALNPQSLSLPKTVRRARIMTVTLLRVRRLGWTFRKATGAPLDSHFNV